MWLSQKFASDHIKNFDVGHFVKEQTKFGSKIFLFKTIKLWWLTKTIKLWWATLKRSFYLSYSPPSAHPSDHKKLYLTLPLSDIRPGANPIKWGQSYTDVYTPHQGGPQGGPIRRSEGGGRTMKGKGGRRRADRRKFLLLFSNTHLCNTHLWWLIITKNFDA